MENKIQESDEGVQNEPGFTSEFSHLYKNSGKDPELSQQQRREVLLRDQKEKRHSIVDRHRDFSELFLEENGEEMTEISDVYLELSEDMDVDHQKLRKRKNRFVLMHSEWLKEVPDDLEENWLVKLAPDGFRVLVMAKKHQTVLLNERGKVLTLNTYLPGGGLDKGHGLTVLDCIYNKTTKTIFVLDCLFWNTMSMIDSESTFRFYWLKNQFDDNARLVDTNKPHKFRLLEFFPAEKSLIQEKIFQNLTIADQNVLYNGVVFYHKELQYAFRQTPLLGWLYTYMLPEKLGIDVPQLFMNKMPENYECLEKYLEELEAKEATKKQKKFYRYKRHEKNNMDVT